MTHKLLFLHGWLSDGSRKTAFLRSLGYEVRTPLLDEWFWWLAVQVAQLQFEFFKPDAVVGISRGAAVAMNMDTSDTPLVLLAPAWKVWGKADTVKPGTIVIHSLHDRMISYAHSVDLCSRSGAALVTAGKDHRLNCPEGQKALAEALERLIGTP